MREFSAEYLTVTREGMWEDSREALANLELPTRQRVLDVGAGTGELTDVVRETVPGEVVAADADSTLLEECDGNRVVGDATRLPFRANAFDLVVCQALLINLPDPAAAVQEFAQVSSDCVAAIEPDNSAVRIESSVAAEAPLARRARELYLQGLRTDASLGDASALFDAAGLEDITVDRYDHVRTVEPPYTERQLEDARRKASGAGLQSDRETILSSDAGTEAYDSLRQEWRSMGRTVIQQMQSNDYHHRETVPFYVTVGQV